MLKQIVDTLKPSWDTAFPYIDAYIKTGLVLGLVKFRDTLEVYSLFMAAILVTATVVWTVIRGMRDYQQYRKSKNENERDEKSNKKDIINYN